MITAQAVAAVLKAAGRTILEVEEADEQYDGQVQLENRIHVQVPTEGRVLLVHREEGEGDDLAWRHFYCYNLDQLDKTVQQAIDFKEE